MAEWLFVVGALFAGIALGMLAVLPFVIRRPKRRGPVRHEVVSEEFPAVAPAAPPRGAPPTRRGMEEASWEHDPFALARTGAPGSRPQAPRPSGPAAPSDNGIPLEWARRQTGAIEPGRSRGVCSNCGTALSVSKRRPIRVACPVCGRTRLLTA